MTMYRILVTLNTFHIQLLRGKRKIMRIKAKRMRRKRSRVFVTFGLEVQ